MPTTLFTLPRELRDEIYTCLAISSSFTFLLACRQFNDEGTPLLYKYGTYRLRALKFRRERLPIPPAPPPISKVQNLYISMPPIGPWDHVSPNHEISRRTGLQLSQFVGTEIRRRVCYFDLRAWTLSMGMAKVLGGFCGFDVVRVEVRLKPYTTDYDGRIRPHDHEQQDEKRKECVRLLEERLEAGLGEAKWENKDSGSCYEEVLVAEFRPRQSKR